MTTVKKMMAEAQKRSEIAGALIPSDVVKEIELRAIEAVQSNEPHKITGGWVVYPFKGQHDMIGLLQVASTTLKRVQANRFEAL